MKDIRDNEELVMYAIAAVFVVVILVLCVYAAKSGYSAGRETMKKAFDLSRFLSHLIDDKLLAAFEYLEAHVIEWMGHPDRAIVESVIKLDPVWSYDYAVLVIKGRFPLGEPMIAMNMACSYYYAHDVVEGRFELGEPTIANDAQWAYDYARYIVKGRFELGEPAMLANPGVKINYLRLLDSFGGISHEELRELRGETQGDDHVG